MTTKIADARCVMLADGTPDPAQRCPGCNALLGEFGIRYHGDKADRAYEATFECGSQFMAGVDEGRLEESEYCTERWYGSRQRLEDVLTQLRAAIEAVEAEGPEQDLDAAAALEAFYMQLVNCERTANPGFWPDSVRRSPEDEQPLEAMCCQNSSKACMFNGPCGIWEQRMSEGDRS